MQQSGGLKCLNLFINLKPQSLHTFRTNDLWLSVPPGCVDIFKCESAGPLEAPVSFVLAPGKSERSFSCRWNTLHTVQTGHPARNLKAPHITPRSIIFVTGKLWKRVERFTATSWKLIAALVTWTHNQAEEPNGELTLYLSSSLNV